MKKEKIILVLDECSRSRIKTNLSVVSSGDVILVTSLAEVTDAILMQTDKVVLLEGILEDIANLSDIRLYKDVFDLKYFFLGSDDRLLDLMRDFAVCYACDISLLDYSLLQAAVYQDLSLGLKDNQSEDFDVEYDFVDKILTQRGTDKDIISLANMLKSALSRENELKEKLRAENANEKIMISKLAEALKLKSVILQDYKNVIRTAEELNASLRQYEISITKNIYQKLNLHKYTNRPSILYFKEYEELPQLDLFIETLHDVFQLQEQKSVKVLRLYDNSGNRKVAMLPAYYSILYNRFLAKDVLANDFICKTGDYVNVLDILLTNKINCDILIIVDCKDHNDIVLDGVSLNYNLCRELDHARMMHLPAANTIISGYDIRDNDEYLVWGVYSLGNMSNDEKFAFLSSRPIVQSILSTHRKFEQSIQN